MNKREIKFRAWDGKQMMYDITQWHVSDRDKKYHLIDGYSLEYLMQFTGLLDKNGIEIYEGDVVRHKSENPNWMPLDDNSPLEIDVESVVEYKGHSFWLSKEYFGWEGEGLADWSNLEVLGNIYEHPNLLTTQP